MNWKSRSERYRNHDRGLLGKPLMVGTQEYKRGLMCHAPSKLVVRLPGPGKTFSSVVGVDANNDPGVKGSVVFSVKVGDKVVFKSDVLRGKMDGVPVNVELGGAKEFTLEVGDAGDGIAYDQADWADARVVMADGKEQWLGDMPVRDSRPGTASGVDLKRLVLLPATAELVPDDKSIRPDGTACRIKADLDKATRVRTHSHSPSSPTPTASGHTSNLPIRRWRSKTS